MKILIASDSFKGSNSSLEVAEAIEEGICRVFPDAEVEKVPIADGGEGTVEALVQANEGEVVHLTVGGPLGDPVDSFYGIVDEGTAVIEMAAASGLDLVPEEKRDVRRASTYGTAADCKNYLLRALFEGMQNQLACAVGGCPRTGRGGDNSCNRRQCYQ